MTEKKLPQTASLFEIENAYEKLAKQWHPDKHKENRRFADQKFRDISQAYETLSDRNKRSHYDDILQQQFTLEDANSTFQKFFEENGIKDQTQQEFFKKNFPEKQENHYKTLGLTKDASLTDIKEAYRKLAIKYHPKNDPGQQAKKKFLKINQAFTVLSDPQRRKTYDNTLYGKIQSERAHGIFQDFWGNRNFEVPKEEEFFRPILKKKWSRDLNRLMDDDDWGDGWKSNRSKQGQTMKSSTVYNRDNRGQSKKTITTKRKTINGKLSEVTTQEYLFPDGHREFMQITNTDGQISSKKYNVRPGQQLPYELTH